MFTHCLLESQAANLVRDYSGSSAGAKAGNAQELHASLVKLMTTGITAQTQRATLESKLIKLRLDRTWTRTVVAFLTHFSHLLKDLQELRDPNDKASYGDTWCTTLSAHAFLPIKR